MRYLPVPSPTPWVRSPARLCSTPRDAESAVHPGFPYPDRHLDTGQTVLHGDDRHDRTVSHRRADPARNDSDLERRDDGHDDDYPGAADHDNGPADDDTATTTPAAHGHDDDDPARHRHVGPADDDTADHNTPDDDR